MNEKTDPESSPAQAPSASAISSAPAAKSQKKPRFALFIATAAGLGYFPKAPGTFGSLAGLAIAILLTWVSSKRALGAAEIDVPGNFWTIGIIPGYTMFICVALVAALGVWSSGRAEQYTRKKDPQFVVIDEVSGQLLTYFMPFVVLNWKSWILGFILFRLFDIWKPFPARQAEALPGGWGIMTDDWVAGIYAALGLWLARAAGL
jgi:phosphatidylglycerophosphatase A